MFSGSALGTRHTLRACQIAPGEAKNDKNEGQGRRRIPARGALQWGASAPAARPVTTPSAAAARPGAQGPLGPVVLGVAAGLQLPAAPARRGSGGCRLSSCAATTAAAAAAESVAAAAATERAASFRFKALLRGKWRRAVSGDKGGGGGRARRREGGKCAGLPRAGGLGSAEGRAEGRSVGVSGPSR